MTYNKPEITVLGDAALVIQGGKPPNTVKEPPSFIQPKLTPAYELDE